MSRRAVVGALAAGVAALPVSAAQAATLQPDRACYASGDPIVLAGSGFTPNVAMTVLGAGVHASPTTDAAGGFTAAATAPKGGAFVPRTVRFAALDPTRLVAWTQVSVVRRAFATNLPLAGRARTRTWWRFAGFEENRPIFGHFRTRGRTVRTYRYGVAHGACGILSVRAPRLPVRAPRPGRWRLKLDQEPSYRRDAPGRIVGFRVSPD